MSTPLLITLIYVAVMSVISIVICVYDKLFSKFNNVKLRIPEKVLMLLAFLGGSVAMYLCMLLIRHKTKHVKFMLGIPIFILLHAAAIFAGFYFGVFYF